MNGQQEMDRGQQAGQQPPVASPSWQRRWRQATHSRWLLAALLTTAIVVSGTVVYLWIRYHASDHEVVLHYTTLLGVDRIGPWWWWLVNAATLVFLCLLNVALLLLYGSHLVFVQRLVAATILLLTIGFIAGIILLVAASRTLLIQ